MVLLSTAMLHQSSRELKLPLILPCCLREKILKDCILSLTDINRVKSGLNCCENCGYEKKQVQQKHFTVFFFFFKLHIFYLANYFKLKCRKHKWLLQLIIKGMLILETCNLQVIWDLFCPAVLLGWRWENVNYCFLYYF